MRQFLVFLALGTGLPAAIGQQPIPKSSCKLDKPHAVLRRVKVPAKYELSLTFPPQPSELTYTFAPGTIVAVNRQQDGWSCVSGSKFVSSEWRFFSGWIPATQLERPPEISNSSDKP